MDAVRRDKLLWDDRDGQLVCGSVIARSHRRRTGRETLERSGRDLRRPALHRAERRGRGRRTHTGADVRLSRSTRSTAAALVDAWYHTGDRGRIDPDGSIWLAGRIKDEINRAGFKVQPAELDKLLSGHPAVAEACAFGQPDPIGGEAVAAAIRLKEGAAATAEELREWCRSRLRREAVPEHWYFVSEIPRNARGKVARSEFASRCRMARHVTGSGFGARAPGSDRDRAVQPTKPQTNRCVGALARLAHGPGGSASDQCSGSQSQPRTTRTIHRGL